MRSRLTMTPSSRKLREVNYSELLAMAAKQNITVAIDSSLLKRARAVAAKRGHSVSALLAEELRLVDTDAEYASARRRAQALLDGPLALGGSRLKREALHDRTRLR